MKCKVRLTCAVELIVEGSSEDAVMDWLHGTTPEEAYFSLASGGEVEFDEYIVKYVHDDADVDYVIPD